MRVILALCAVTAVAADSVRVNFNACSGEDDKKAVTEPTCGLKQLVRYQETEFPPFDDLNATTHTATGLIPKLFKLLCETETISGPGIECIEIRDKWTNVWGGDDYPGEGMLDGWYHLAFAFVNSLRANSMIYSHHVSERVNNHFVFRKDNPRVPKEFPEKAEGLTVCLAKGYGDTHAVKDTYSLANFTIAANADEQFEFLLNDVGTTVNDANQWCDVAWVPVDEFLNREPNTTDGVYAVFDAHVASNGVSLALDTDKHTNAVAFMFTRKNKCVRDLVNTALEELRVKKQDVLDVLFKEYASVNPKSDSWVPPVVPQ
eukprot:TRINITY_DN4422_c0_g3_i1.p1 TRINITY_DN4422_c0_g3~~TRINITY_DN4422_c0_g3_i1.p1  ORF type:complete len:317 (+),score=112.76 TRINITY_DN4422_c0_g3_i1:72-1022(+)